ncbi:hypothetical protein SB757_29255, partial [Pseudomonas sp. SIMBA_065]
MNGLKAIAEALESGGVEHEIQVDETLRQAALLPLNRMLSFAAELKLNVKGNAEAFSGQVLSMDFFSTHNILVHIP